MLQLKGAFEAYHSSDTKSSVLKSENHRSPFDMRSSVPRVPAGRVLLKKRRKKPIISCEAVTGKATGS